MKSILWLVPKSPLPAADGARVASCSLIRSLARQGTKIHLLIMDSDEIADEKFYKMNLGVASVTVIEPAFGRLDKGILQKLLHILSMQLRPLVPLTLQRFSSGRIRNAVHDTAVSKNCGAILFDGLHTAAAMVSFDGLFNGLSNNDYLYRAHNRESLIWQRKSETTANKLLSLFLKFQSRLVKRFENSLVAKVSYTFAVSSEDAHEFVSDQSSANVVVVPIGQDFSNQPELISKTNNLFFIGRLDWMPNQEGLKWFLDLVWPTAYKLNSALRLDIVGSGESSWLKDYANLPGIRIHGRVDSVEDYYSNATCCIIPVFFGSGTRVKAIEASKYARPCLSTSLGVEGLPLVAGKSFLQANTKEEWIKVLVNITDYDASGIGERARETLIESFDEIRCAKIVQEHLAKTG